MDSIRHEFRSSGSAATSSHLTGINVHEEDTSKLDLDHQKSLNGSLSTTSTPKSDTQTKPLPNEIARNIEKGTIKPIRLPVKDQYKELRISLPTSHYKESLIGVDTTSMVDKEHDRLFDVDVSTISHSPRFSSNRDQKERMLVDSASWNSGHPIELQKCRLGIFEKKIMKVNNDSFPLLSYEELHVESLTVNNLQKYNIPRVFYQVIEGNEGVVGRVSKAAEEVLAHNWMQKHPAARSLSKAPWAFPRSLRLVRRRLPEPKITIIDDRHRIFAIDLVSEEECDLILQFIEAHVQNATTAGLQSWRKLYEYTHFDLPCCEILALRGFTTWLMNQIRTTVGRIFRAPWAASRLVPRSWKEPHLLRYQNTNGIHTQAGMKMHFDGSDLTWQLMLSAYGRDYEGGGTYFSSIRKTIRLRKGQVLLHPGDLFHRGVDIYDGARTLMVCFMDGFNPKVVDSSDWKEDSTSFESNFVHA